MECISVQGTTRREDATRGVPTDLCSMEGTTRVCVSFKCIDMVPSLVRRTKCMWGEKGRRREVKRKRDESFRLSLFQSLGVGYTYKFYFLT